jgi:hypothetical protein
MTSFLGNGWKFPIRINGRGGLSYSNGEQSIREAIWIILGTPLNSRIMDPTFGCGIHTFVFAPNNANTRAAITKEVNRALLRWEPRIDVLRVHVQDEPDNANTLLIFIDYRVRANSSAHNIVYPFYINEG